MPALPVKTPAKGMLGRRLCLYGTALACTGLLFSTVELSAGQKELMEKKVRELIELNRIVVEKNVDLKKFNNQTVYIKARLQQISNSEYNVKVEEVSVEGIKTEGKKGDDGSIVIKAKISEKPDKTYYLDMEHLLPPEKKEDDNKEKEKAK
ncbi:MAG TPA: hypothetical protein DET40_23550 [Lentisphaeria bacterium]|nr:MAG: hypothetical protein A2X45_23765 [Lentisphaerae bacterium GWF2_50_93]HCE46532.1 hypothetical protein [Lentisphaeria bacterium]